MSRRVYLSPPDAGELERELLLDAFDSNWLAPLGPHVDLFEQELAQRVGVEHGAALSSGTAALHLGLLLAGVGAGDEVIVPSLTFVATANAVRYLGAEPVFVDSDPASWSMDGSLLTEELDARARRGTLPAAVVSVDLLGGCPDYDIIETACSRFEVPLVEDAAEALGATYAGRPAGSFGLCGTFSFNGNKIITTSGGGMLVSNSSSLVHQARFLASQAREPAPHYEHEQLGYNYRLSNLLAALGRGQLQGLDGRIARRREIHQSYRDAFEGIDGLEMMPVGPRVDPNYWMTCITIDPLLTGFGREDVRLALEALNVESRPVWKPLHLQPLYREATTVGGKVAEDVFDRGLCLPSGTALTRSEQECIVAAVLDLVAD
ncbi:MAG TPA: aminotransferase class I/II-fold pyridoxal phosphate-dependent enzyme [Acidimicrobiales bacterium]|nr:aminotransferase class I/II-fold pyridoxal phosphate-dependent enzyme [Acidimicrobiales bacterium]